MDISESGKQIGEKLFVLLNKEQRTDLIEYLLEQKTNPDSASFSCAHSSSYSALKCPTAPLTEIEFGVFYFCLEERRVCICGKEIELTAKEFDALSLLLLNPKRVLTFETISVHVWGEEYFDNTPKTVHNLMSRLRIKLKISDDIPDYIVCIRGVGYKFNA